MQKCKQMKPFKIFKNRAKRGLKAKQTDYKQEYFIKKSNIYISNWLLARIKWLLFLMKFCLKSLIENNGRSTETNTKSIYSVFLRAMIKICPYF